VLPLDAACCLDETSVGCDGVYEESESPAEGDVAREFLGEVVQQAQTKGLTSDEHFTVDGTLIEAWASLKSFQRRDQKNRPLDDPGNPSVDFHGETFFPAVSRGHGGRRGCAHGRSALDGAHPARHGLREGIDIGGERRIMLQVRGGVLAHDVDDRR
jgi:hypothetical protein